MVSHYWDLSFQNGGAPLLYAVHGNHVRCVEILLGESLLTKCVSASQHIVLQFLTLWCMKALVKVFF